LNKERFFEVIIIAVTSILFYFSIKWGLDFAGGDSMAYYEMAISAQNGEGFFIKTTSTALQSPTHWSPGTSFLAALISKIFNTNILSTFTFLNYILLVFNILLFKKIANVFLKKENYVFFITFLFLFSYSTLVCHLELSSEPLFMFFSFLGFIFWKKYDYQATTKNLVFAAFFFGLAAITRYLGIVFFISVAFLLLFENISRTLEYKKLLIFCGVFMFFPSLIFLRNHLLFSEVTDRIMIFHTLPFRKILQMGQTILGWFSPLVYDKKFKNIGIIFAGLNIFVFLKMLYFYVKTNKISNFYTFQSIFILSYFAFLVFSISFFDVFTNLDYRILYPIFPIFLIGFGMVLQAERDNFYKKTITFSLIFSYLSAAYLTTVHNFTQGNDGSTSPKYQQDKGILFLKGKYPTTKIYSNIADILKMNGLYNVAYTPFLYDPSSLLENKNFNTEIEKQLNDFRNEKAVFIFANEKKRDFFASEKQIMEILQQNPDTLSENILIFK
jgi:hypothetical protein